ncbi:hypothetical protein [Aquimarina sediminis]|uniref:hypothetical protein n=1 Tax=Aquimarina sediminis TaxID=2070536 RepID=UPI000CA04CC4|nr:hypothetical protein [Aquimarina sediminis]
MASKKEESKKQPLDPMIQKIADKLKQLRIDSGHTSYETFAWEHGIGRMQYWKMEKGSNFTMKSLLRILRAHKISLADFFKDFESYN